MLEIFLDAILDTVKLIPFLFLTYLLMEYLETKMNDKMKNKIKSSGKYGPFIGAFLGVFPQCGFSASATNLYSSRFITLGTLMAVYLSTSDEMIPIFISSAVPGSILIKILLIKIVFGICIGFFIDFILKLLKKENSSEEKVEEFCHSEKCNCEKNGIIKSSIKHTINIILYIFIATLVINGLIHIIGEENIELFIYEHNYIGPIVASLIGLIPNCCASVILTNLYVENIINMASLIGGLLTGAGIGLIVLFKTNKKHLKENIFIVSLLYLIGVVSGLLLQIFL